MFTDPQFFFWKNRNLKNSLNRKANIHVSVKFNRSDANHFYCMNMRFLEKGIKILWIRGKETKVLENLSTSCN